MTEELRGRFCGGSGKDGKPCTRQLFKVSGGAIEHALRPGRELEIKCPACGTLHLLRGTRSVVLLRADA